MVKTLYSEIRARCREHGDKVAVFQYGLEGHQEFRFSQVFTEIEALRFFLSQRGFAAGARIALLSENRYEWLVSYLAITSMGFTAVPLDPKLQASEWTALLRHSESCFLFAAESLLEGRDLTAEIPHFLGTVLWDPAQLSLSWITPYSQAVQIAPASPIPIQDLDPASLVYTSGTTGHPKGVMLSQAGLLNNAQEISLGQGHPGEVLASILPLHHLFGFSVACATWLQGVSLVFYDEINPTVVMRSFSETRPHILLGVPLFYERLALKIRDRIHNEAPAALRGWLKSREQGPWAQSYEHRLWLKKILFRKVHKQFGSRLSFAGCGGAALEDKAQATFNMLGIPLFQGYGLSETSSAITSNRFEAHRFGSVGKAFPGSEVQIRNATSDGIGEIWMRGPGRMIAYYKDEAATAEVLDSQGWFDTQDLGRLDADGYLFVTGRKKDLIVGANGEKVFPDEVEFHFREIVGIQELCVFGVPRGINLKGELVHMLVVADPTLFPEESPESIFEKLKTRLQEQAEKLPDFKRPKSIEFSLESLPRTTTLKVRRFELRQAYLDRLVKASLVRRVEQSSPQGQIASMREFVLSSLGRLLPEARDIQTNSHLSLDLGIDSLTALEFWAMLEESLGMKIPKEEVFRWQQVNDIVTYLESKTGG